MPEQVSITEAVDGELPSTNNLDKHLILLRPGTLGTHHPAIPNHRTANRVDQFIDRAVRIEAGQSICITFIRSLRNLSSSLDVGYSPSHFSPYHSCLGDYLPEAGTL